MVEDRLDCLSRCAGVGELLGVREEVLDDERHVGEKALSFTDDRNPCVEVKRRHAVLVDLEEGRGGPALAPEVEQWTLRHGSLRPFAELDAVGVKPELAAPADLALQRCLPSSAQQPA